MKTRINILILCFLAIAKAATSQNLTQIIEQMSKELASQGANQMTMKSIVNKTITINSASNARLYASNTRDAIKVELPTGTKKWFYRITVLDIDSKYSYQPNESLYYLLSNSKTMSTYAPTKEAVDFYLLDHSGEVESFKTVGNDNFKSNARYTKLRTNTFVGECTLNQENLWIGIKNPNSFVGLKVIVEVVSWGN